MIAVEKQHLIGRRREPGVLLDFAIQLAGSPAGITESQQTLAWPTSGCNDLQDVEAGGECERVVHTKAAFSGPIGRMQYEAARVIHRASGAKPNLARWGYRGDFQLTQKVVERGAHERSIENKAHRTVAGVSAYIYDALGKSGVGHRRHRDQQLAGQETGGVLIAIGADCVRHGPPEIYGSLGIHG